MKIRFWILFVISIILFTWQIGLTAAFIWYKVETDEKIVILDDALYVGVSERKFKKFNGIPYDSYDYTIQAVYDILTNKR